MSCWAPSRRSGRPDPVSAGGRNWRLVRANTDAVPSSARRFMARARRRRLRAAVRWAVTAGVLVVAGALTWVVYGTSVLAVRQVKVVGVQLLDPGQVELAADVPPDEPLARVDLDAVRARVRAIPAVDRVTVKRGWPSTLVGGGGGRTGGGGGARRGRAE